MTAIWGVYPEIHKEAWVADYAEYPAQAIPSKGRISR